jgi:methionyl-tRNA formyltransferase
LTFLFNRQLSDLAKKMKIPMYKHTFFDESFYKFVKNKETKYIFYSAPNIVKHKYIPENVEGLICYHCAPLPEYRGSSNYFWMVKNQENNVHSTMFYLDEGVDTGKVLLRSKEIKISKGTTIFSLWKELRLTAYSNFIIIMDKILNGKSIDTLEQPSSNVTTRSFPTRADGEKIQSMGYHIFSLTDLFYIYNLSKIFYIGEEK